MGKSGEVQGGKQNSAYGDEYLSGLLLAREPEQNKPQQQHLEAKWDGKK